MTVAVKLRSAALGIPALAVALAGVTACSGKISGKEGVPEPREVYEFALRKMEKKRYYSARTLLQEILPRIPPDDRELLPKVQLAIADAFYRDGGLLNYGEAFNGYRNFLTFFPSHEKADYAQFMVGMSLFKQVLAPDRDQATTRQAIVELRKVEALYPFSDYVPDARQAIEECMNRLAEHEWIVGRFYQRRESWEAAIDRYRTIIERFPRFDRTDEVLLECATCLLEIRNRTEAADLLDRLAREYPDGKLVERGRRMLEEYDRKRARDARKAAS